MKNKIVFISLVLLLSFSVCPAQNLDISIECNLKKFDYLPIHYWVSNNMGEDIPDVEYVLNDSYFYKSSLPASGDSLNLFEFAKRDGTRFNFFLVKPIELKVKSKKGVYVVKFDDIPHEREMPSPEYPSEEWRDNREILEWYQGIGVLKIPTAYDIPCTLIVNMALGYTKNNKSTPQELTARKIEIIDFLQTYFNGKTIAELEQLERIRLELRNEINDNILIKNKIKDVRFTQYDIITP